MDNDMCTNEHPVNFMINRSPINHPEEWFYGISYQGKRFKK